ncbi:Ig-like domain-containing protein, partial [Patescibacteria group bacterium]|nr:Ig-like domain-containing protein [Patescibacteria group bacterium]
MPRTKRFTFLIILLFGIAIFALPALAQVDLGLEYGESLGLTSTDIRITIGRIINAFLGLLGIVAVLLILYAGFLWMTAGGDSQQIDKAKAWMRNGVIGLVIIMSAYAIASFILGAIQRGTLGEGAGGPGGPGGGGIPGSRSVFSVAGVAPIGSGPRNNGWPKNYAIQVAFTADIFPGSVSPASFAVTRCNPRLSGDEPRPFNEADCDVEVVGTRAIESNRIIFRPNASPEEDPTYFEHDYWYRVSVNDGLQDTRGRRLICWPTLGDISSPEADRYLCDRAMAFSNQVDITPPTVSIGSPVSYPAYCSEQIEIRATARDDFLPTLVSFRLNGGAANLVDEFFDPYPGEATVFNSSPVDPFEVFEIQDDIYIDARGLETGVPHTLTAVAADGVPQSGAMTGRKFYINPAHCCNGVIDADQGEEGEDCGGECRGCPGSACTTHEDCASGYCNPDTGRCEDRPIITDVTPLDAGPGSLITISGRFFGSRPGRIVFLGAEGEADDVTVEACDPAAWQHNEVIVAVPAAAVSGPLMLITAAGPADRTDDEFGDPVHDFTVTADVLPGICYLEPSVGSSGSAFNIHGSGFGAAIGDSLVRMDGVDIGRGGMTWAANLITAIVPTVLREGIYPVRVVVGGVRPSNPANFTLRLSSSAGGPRIEEIRPATGPVGSYVTILGSGFGNRRGQVYFLPEVGDDIALGLEPICADNWHDNYIVVKVPRTPGLTQEIIEENEGELFVEEGDYKVQVITSVSGQPSNRVGFEVTDAAVPPGMCSISPVSGPPGTVITVQGEGFGTGPGNVAAMGGAFNPARPENSLRFYLRGVMSDLLPRPDYVSMASGLYPAWGGTSLRAVVPGDRGNPATWPVSGPVHVVAENVWARNPIPFNVQNCNVDNTCAEGTTCCRDGSCHTPDDPCQDERNSAFGWLFSTNVLPNYPRVLRRSCVLGVDHPVRQSPTPADRLTNVCLDAQVAVAFTTEMLPESLRDPASILFEECGNGDSLDCSGGELVPIDRATINIAVEADEAGRRTVIAFRPQAGAYPPDDPADPDDLPGNRQLRPGYWYRVTLRSNPGEGFGIVDMDGRYLDGNFDRRPGGDYSWFFRAKQDRTPCEIAGVFVNPGRATIEHQGVPNTVFEAVPTDGRCVELECVAGGGYRIDWSIDGGHISPAPRPPAHPRAHCVYYASGERETPEGESDRLFCALTPDDGELPLRGVSLVRVAFADPTVTKVSPADGCEEACTNALIYAQFNVPMNEGSLTAPGNVQLFECRNPSCNPPFNLIPFAVVADAPAVPADPARGMMRVTIVPRGRLRPLTHYVVRLKGGDETGITSISLVPLTGLNTAGWYQWSFRTVEDAEGCAIGRVELRPNYATLYYVGQRLGLNLTARSRPNTCDPDGLELVADEYDWEWGINPNPVLRGFVSAAGWPLRVDDTTTVDTDSTLPRGCTDRCLMTGSLPNVPACGNGLPAERGEDCDDGNVLDGDGCSSNCLVSGTEPPACGNGAINVGENCEALPDPLAGGALVFPRGCMDPRQDYNGDGRPEGWGCILLGSTAGRSTCGDRIRADGEACDDGNTRDGDGCSRDCLNEGTVQLCTIATPAGELCVSSCGNGLTEPGEECDDGNTNRGDGCSANCLYEGALVGACPPPVPGDPPPMNCCGNGVVEAGFGEACDDGNASNNDGCSDRCLREGSSAFHDTPSFCGDGVLNAPAEHPRCDGRMLGPDGFTDTYQVVMSRDNDTDDPALATSTVTADHPEVPAGQEGNSRVTLACTCGVAVDGDAHCAAIVDAIRLGELPGPLPDEPLGCAVSGCCVAKPRVLSYDPVAGRDDICRNGIISVFFDQPMDSVSVKQNLKVGYYNADGCGEGVEVVRPIAIAEVGGQPRGLLARLWQHVVGFVQRIISPVFGAPAIPLPAVADFCLVNGQVVTPSATEAEFWPSEPYPADAW